MPVIDFRLRPPLRGFLDMIMYSDPARRDRLTRKHGFEPAESARARSMDLLIQEMDRAGITTGVMVGRYSGAFGSVANKDIMEIVQAYPGRFVGVASINPVNRKLTVVQIASAVEAGFRAINIEPGSYPVPMLVDDRRLYPIYAYCEDRNLPVVIMAGGSAGPDLGYTDPIHLDRVAADFPDLRIVVSHGGWPWVHQMLHIAYRRPNVYLSPDQYLANMPGSRDYIDAANGFLADRFIYGSSYPFTPADKYLEWFRSLPLKPESMQKALYDNAADLLGIRAAAGT